MNKQSLLDIEIKTKMDAKRKPDKREEQQMTKLIFWGSVLFLVTIVITIAM